jgi:hypothetical protein
MNDRRDHIPNPFRSTEALTDAVKRRVVVLLHIVDRSDLMWIPPLVHRTKVEAYTKDYGFELAEILSDGFESAEDPAFFNRAFQVLEDGKAEVLLPLKLEAGGRLVPWDPKAG